MNGCYASHEAWPSLIFQILLTLKSRELLEPCTARVRLGLLRTFSQCRNNRPVCQILVLLSTLQGPSGTMWLWSLSDFRWTTESCPSSASGCLATLVFTSELAQKSTRKGKFFILVLAHVFMLASRTFSRRNESCYASACACVASENKRMVPKSRAISKPIKIKSETKISCHWPADIFPR